MKNLVILAAGENSLHRNWAFGGNFDVFLIYYGNRSGRYRNDVKYYKEQKGPKYKLIYDLIEDNKEFLDNYDNFFLPDDDLYYTTKDLNLFFSIFSNYNLSLAQPSITGYYSVPLVLNCSNCLLRYVNWVEIMCPCFSKACLQLCKHTFAMNNTAWGIEYVWNHLLGSPEDKIAIIDKVAFTHVRPCFSGDNYYLNNFYYETCLQELLDIQASLGDCKFKTYKMIGCSNEKILIPDLPKTKFFTEKIYPNDIDFIRRIDSFKNKILFA